MQAICEDFRRDFLNCSAGCTSVDIEDGANKPKRTGFNGVRVNPVLGLSASKLAYSAAWISSTAPPLKSCSARCRQLAQRSMIRRSCSLACSGSVTARDLIKFGRGSMRVMNPTLRGKFNCLTQHVADIVPSLWQQDKNRQKSNAPDSLRHRVPSHPQ